jgi:hypothetical protein
VQQQILAIAGIRWPYPPGWSIRSAVGDGG